MPASSQVLDPIRVTFDDSNAVADAGLVLTGTLAGRLGLEQLVDDGVSRGYRPGRKLLTLVSTLLAGGDCIDDVDLLRAGATASIVGHDTVAASTVGDLAAQLDVRAHPSARRGHRDRPGTCVGGGGGAGRRADVHRCGLDHM